MAVEALFLLTEDAGFEAGRDDYLVKPFESCELLQRYRALRRVAAAPPDPVIAAPIGTFALEESLVQPRTRRHAFDIVTSQYPLSPVAIGSLQPFNKAAIFCRTPHGSDYANLDTIDVLARFLATLAAESSSRVVGVSPWLSCHAL